MRHRKKGRKFGREKAARTALVRSLSVNFFLHGRIETTEARAKTLKSEAEKMITTAKKGTLFSRRLLMKKLNDRLVVDKLLAEIGPRYRERAGGYTRLIRLGQRLGDGAPTVIIELV